MHDADANDVPMLSDLMTDLQQLLLRHRTICFVLQLRDFTTIKILSGCACTYSHSEHNPLNRNIHYQRQPTTGLARSISPIYIIDINPIFSIFSIFIEFLKYFLMWHIVTMFWFSVCVFCWLMTCALSIFSVLDNFCQISPLHSNSVWITRVLHLICNAHTHILLFGSKFHIILAMYVQMLDICIENIEYIKKNRNIRFSIFSKISRYFPTLADNFNCPTSLPARF